MSTAIAVSPQHAATSGKLSLRTRCVSAVGLAGVPAGIATVTFGVCLAVGLLRYFTYHAWAYDLGYFTQVVDRTAAGHPFQTTFAPYSFLGQHWEPVLLLPALLARVVSTPVLLLGLQSFALALAPVAAWRLARAWIGGRVAPAVVCLATALSPLLASAAIYDFHPEAATPALALFALDASARGRGRWFLVLVAALFLVKEDAMLVAAGVGWIAWRADGRRAGLAVVAAGFAAFAVTVGIVMPAFRGGRPADLVERYSYLGSTPTRAMLGLVTRPREAITHLFGSDARLGWLRALGPLAFLPLLSGSAFLGVLPILGVALLSTNTSQASLDLQYGVEVLPLMVACALLGMRRLAVTSATPTRRPSRDLGRGDRHGTVRQRRVVTAMASAVAAAAVIAYVGGARLPGGRAFDRGSVSGLDRRSAAEAVLGRIPVGASVSASSGLVAHLADRPEIYQFPDEFLAGQLTAFVAINEVEEQPRGDGAAHQRLLASGYHLVVAAGGLTLWGR